MWTSPETWPSQLPSSKFGVFYKSVDTALGDQVSSMAVALASKWVLFHGLGWVNTHKRSRRWPWLRKHVFGGLR
jgi:hypothetical protein